MKRLCIVVTILFFVAIGCKKASGPADGNSIQPNNNRDSMVSMTAQVNGQSWKTDSAFAYIINTSGNDSTVSGIMINAIQKESANNTTSTINIYLNTFTGPGTYLVDPPYNTATYYAGTQRNFATTGQVVITIDTAYSLIGTFSFIAGTDTISNGVFNVSMP